MNRTGFSCTAANCRKIDDDEMVSCERCTRWWHYACANFNPDLYKSADPWFCDREDCAAKAGPSKIVAEPDAEVEVVLTQPVTCDPVDVEASVDILIEAAAVAQAKVAQKDAELAALRSELEKTKQLLASESAEKPKDVVEDVSTARTAKVNDERREMIRKIQANHQTLLENGFQQRQSTPVRGAPSPRGSFSDSIIRQSDMSSLLTILNRSNVQELPTFSGENKREWPYFEEVFNSTTAEGKYNGKENVARLRKALKGEAFQLVSDRLKYSSDDVAIIDSLRSIYGRPDILVHGLTSELLSLPTLKSKCDPNIHLWAVRVNGFVADIKSMKRDEDLNNGYVLTDLSCKLGPGLYQDWRRRNQTIPQPTLKDFAEFLTEKIVELPPELVKPLVSGPSSRAQGLLKSSRRVLTHQPPATSTAVVSCGKCGRKQHAMDQCQEFKALTPESRLAYAKEKSICFTCLDPVQHIWRTCARSKPCGISGCARRHHPLLHQTSIVKPELNAAATPYVPQGQIHSSHAGAQIPIIFKIAPIRIYGSNNKFVDTFAFLDDGSALTMIERDLFDDLGLEGESEQLTLQWTKGVSRIEDSIRTTVAVSGVESRKRHLLKNVYSVKDLELPRQSIDVAKLKREYPHLRGLPITDLIDAKPKILVGLDQAKFLLGHGQRHGKEDEPCAAKTLLGWIVYGKVAPPITVSCAQQAAKPTMQLMYHDAIKGEDELHDLVRRHFSTEEFGVMAPKGDLVSKEDSRALDIMERTLKFVDGRYEIGLLWRQDNVKLPDSYPMALKRLIGLENSLRKRPHLLEWMNNYMVELLSKRYARVATDEDLLKEWPRVWYAPTLIVENLNKSPPKPRVVADVAAKVNGVSLNSFLLKGPDNLVSLHAGLFKLRERKVAVNADVKEMFHQIRVKSEDQHCQRILWRNGDSSKIPDVFIMEVMMFGPRCSPTCAQFVKNHHANRFNSECPEACDGLTKRTYVDDYFNSHDTLEDAVSVTDEAIRICMSMGFKLVGVQSNCVEVMRRLPTDHVNAKLVSIDPSESDEVSAKVLGMYWLPSCDQLIYKLSDEGAFAKMRLAETKISKREILRMVMRIFDPLGLISLLTIRGRVVLQEIWREGFDWDEPVSDQLKLQWQEFAEVLTSLKNLRIPRRYSSWSPDCSQVSLITFVDASEKAFAAVSYLRFEQDGDVEVSLVMAKAKVAPVKKLSIPRLELQAAILGVRLASTIKSSHTIRIHKAVFLSDSKTVLSWINSTTYKFPSFVAVRVGEILESTSPREWFYIKTNDNVADDATRWSEPTIRQDARWFVGPDFLREDFNLWPVSSLKSVTPEESLEDRDLHLMLHVGSPKISYSVYEELSARFQARWGSSVRVIAYLLRLKDVLRRRSADKEVFITPREFHRAEDWVFRKIQQDAFPEDVASLQATGKVKTSSSIFSLSPFLDEEGTIRLSSRAQRAKVSYASRNPAILPKTHPLVDLLAQFHHERNLHVGTELIISDVRERAWIIHIRVVVERVKSRCNMCKRLRANPMMPRMGLLPEARLAFDSRPFTHVGVDCFGPLLAKMGRGTVKRYGMIFTCLTFRTVQIELLNDLSLDQCTMAVRRFVINRVVTRFLYSDNGLNFVGTKNLMDRDVKKMEETLSEYAANYEGILWRFIPAYSPWMGGAWERLIQSIKGSISFILKGVVPREDVLRNALIEAQGQVNRRPLTHIPVDPEDPRPLTPNTMLFGEQDRDVTAPGVFCESDAYSRLYSRRSQHLMTQFVKRWYCEYLPEITRRSKWYKDTKPVEVGQIVILFEPNEIRSVWQLGRIVAVYPGADGIVRMADVRLSSGAIKMRRAVGRLAVLDILSSPEVQTGPGMSSSQ